MKIRGHTTRWLSMSVAFAAMTGWTGVGADHAWAQAPGMGAPPSKVEITIKDRQHGYETVGLTMPSHETTVVVRNQDTVTHGFASKLFKDTPVRMEGGIEVAGRNFKSYHVDPGKTMTLHFSTAPSKFDVATGIAESMRHALWCDIHPEVKGELYVIETRGEVGGG